ncbi:protein cueball [Folsomia candida]|uniref:protein cueball n=1 Tax=Folsomia candida TaxID=158441 RepID=UPI000B8F957B|nr:protein cueball [Folsomia candida]
MGGEGGRWTLAGLFFLVLPLLLEGIQLTDYELVVGNGARLLFFNYNHSLNVDVTEWTPKTKIISIVPHVPSNTLYFTVKTKDTASIFAFNPHKNATQLLHRGVKGSVGTLAIGLKENQDTLFWANPLERSVWSQPLSLASNATLLFQDPNATFDSIAFHPATGQILYTVWRRSNESEILAYNLATHTTTSLLGDVFQPRGLHVDVAGDSLYWIDNPPGIYFNVGRVDLRGLNGQTADRTVLLKDQNQHPFALTLACSNLLWTDLMNKALWEWSPELKTYKQLMSFNNTAPHGLARLANPTCPPPNEMTTTQYPHSMLPSPEESSVEDIAPPPSTTIGENGVNHHQVSNISSCEVEEERVCLNGAACFKIHDQLHCLCKPGFLGPNCGDEEEKRGTDCIKATEWASSNNNPSMTPVITVALVGLTCLVVVLLLVVAGLLCKVRRWRKKPTIRRRVVVSHRSDLEANPSTVCEMIDIENCCNMNVCETPCYERMGSFSVGSSVESGGGRTRKTSVKEDKKCLLSSSS